MANITIAGIYYYFLFALPIRGIIFTTATTTPKVKYIISDFVYNILNMGYIVGSLTPPFSSPRFFWLFSECFARKRF